MPLERRGGDLRPPKTLYNRNVRWSAKGVWRTVFSMCWQRRVGTVRGADRQHAFEGAPLGSRR
jgi:hypothetical protein